MNNFLIINGWDICEIGAENNMDMSVAPDLFCENLETYVKGEPVHYAGGDADYDVLSPMWKEMSADEKADAKTSFRHFWRDNRDELTEARRVGSRAKFDDIGFHYIYKDDVVAPDYVLYRGAYDIYCDAMDDGTTLAAARDAYIAELEAGDFEDAKKWKIETDQMHQDEIAWFDAKVVTYDKGLEYGYKTRNRDFFNRVLATR